MLLYISNTCKMLWRQLTYYLLNTSIMFTLRGTNGQQHLILEKSHNMLQTEKTKTSLFGHFLRF